jgi:hypothetical protein
MPDHTAPLAPMCASSTLAEPRIVAAQVTAGHDGQAELVLHVRFENGVTGSVTLNALFAQRLMEDCRVDSAEQLIGQPCQRLFDLRPDPVHAAHPIHPNHPIHP